MIKKKDQLNRNKKFVDKAKQCFAFLKFIYSEKATNFCKNSTLLLCYVVPVKSKVEILQNFVAFSEYMSFIHQNSNLLYSEVDFLKRS